jgi:hypothetical protein
MDIFWSLNVMKEKFDEFSKFNFSIQIIETK